ncbi:tRNA-methyltransferase O [Popillia japonica]|uniref:tRNA-methyltransferase O n=1 Tax=Popillia japonica TaxID=7064 RepID=A0AAW1MI54_POPJA
MSLNDNNTQDVKYLKNQLNVARNEINNLRQQLKSLVLAHRKDCDEIRDKLENWRCLECRNRQLQDDNADALVQNENQPDLSLKYIGTIHTLFPEKRGTPRQPGICSDMVAKLTLNNEIFTNPVHALEGLQEYSHMWILFHFHRNDSTHIKAKVAPPRLNGLRTGVFATRSPHRPCPIGLSLVKIDRIMENLSLVKIDRIMENTIYFSGVDMVDQTPVLDIKPYIPQYDNPTVSVSQTPVLDRKPYIPQYDNPTVSVSNPSEEDLLCEGGVSFNDMHLSTDSMFNISSIQDSNDVEVAAGYDNMNNRIMDGEENGGRNQNVVGVNSSSSRNNAGGNLEESLYSRSTSRIGEREAPDGEEEESSRQPTTGLRSSTNVTTPEGHIRVPPWIDHPPVSSLTVVFKDRAIVQLNQLGSEAEEKKAIITNVLREDPRSVYLRERLGSHCYVFRIADLNVSCKFNDPAHTVTSSVYLHFLFYPVAKYLVGMLYDIIQEKKRQTLAKCNQRRYSSISPLSLFRTAKGRASATKFFEKNDTFKTVLTNGATGTKGHMPTSPSRFSATLKTIFRSTLLLRGTLQRSSGQCQCRFAKNRECQMPE